jgi:hypothetical protein
MRHDTGSLAPKRRGRAEARSRFRTPDQRGGMERRSLPAQVRLQPVAGLPVRQPSNACNSITVAITRAGTAGRSRAEPVYRPAK